MENVQGKGTFVMERGNELMKERARGRIMDKLREVSIEAKAADISLLDLLGMFESVQGTIMNDSSLPQERGQPWP